jgi:DNA-binding CsgD family transcriptional regulator
MALVREVEAGRLLERGGELRAIEAAVAAGLAGDGATVVIEGAAGIGKTRLLAAARETASAAGMQVRSARGSDLERDFQWGVVRQLLEPVVAGLGAEARRELLAGAARLAAPLVAPDEESTSPDPAAAGEGAGPFLHGLYWLCANLATRHPLLLAADDAHWCDLPSLRFVEYVARRIAGLRLVLVVAARPGESRDDERELLERVAADPNATVLSPAPLSSKAVGEVLSTRLGTDPAEAFAAACHTATQGNPFLLEELVRAVSAERLPADAERAAMVADLGPRSVAQAIARRVRALTPRALELARAVSVLGPDAELRMVAALAGVDLDVAAPAVDALVAAEVLSAARPLDFIHPLARAAVYGDLPSGERAALHGRAARMLAGEAAAASRVAAHLLATEPAGDAWTVDALRSAAKEAMDQGAPPAAVTYLERALAEPPSAAERGSVLRELGRAEGAGGHVRASEEHLRKAIELAPTARERAAIMLDLARTVGVADWERAGLVYLEALAVTPPEDALALTLEGELITIALNVYSLAEPVRPILARRLSELAAGVVDDPLLLGALGLALSAAFPPASHGAAVAARASDLKLIEYNSNLPGCVGNSLLFAGDLERSAEYFGAMAEEARRRGWFNGTAWSSGVRARVSLQLGEVRRAEEEGRLGLDLLENTAGQTSAVQRGYFVGHLGEVLVERAALEEADALLSAYPIAAERAATYGEVLVLYARSCLRLAQGRLEEALADALATIPSAFEEWNPATAQWRSNAAVALAGLGRRAEARELAESDLRLARAFGAPHAISRALRAVARSEEDAGKAVSLLEEAIETVESTAARLELTHAVVELGEVLRRAGKRRVAIDQLRRGLDLAHRCGATALAARARSGLVTAGARPRRELIRGVDALTTSERRVAELAARGMTNRDIAQALFVTARTVEGHLTHAYQKLGIASRQELPRALAGDEEGEV